MLMIDKNLPILRCIRVGRGKQSLSPTTPGHYPATFLQRNLLLVIFLQSLKMVCSNFTFISQWKTNPFPQPKMITCTVCQKQLTTVTFALQHRAEHSDGVHLLNCDAPRCSFVTVDPAQLQLNDTAFFRGTQSFTVRNGGSRPQSYTLSHIPAGTMQSLRPGSIQVNPGREYIRS